MNNKWNRLALTLSTLVSTAAFAPAAMANGGNGEETEIPTQLSNGPRDGEPDGTCSMCTVDVLVSNDSSSTSATAMLELYFDDNQQDEVTDIELRVLLTNDEYRTVTIPSAELYDGEFHTFDLAPGEGWDWLDARHVWVEVM